MSADSTFLAFTAAWPAAIASSSVVGLRRGTTCGVAVERERLDAVGHAVELAVVRRGARPPCRSSRVSWSAESCSGSMAPFWTRLPIQSCAPTTTSGPLPAALAVTKLVWRSDETACTSTLIPLSAANLSATALTRVELEGVGPDHEVGVAAGGGLVGGGGGGLCCSGSRESCEDGVSAAAAAGGGQRDDDHAGASVPGELHHGAGPPRGLLV